MLGLLLPALGSAHGSLFGTHTFHMWKHKELMPARASLWEMGATVKGVPVFFLEKTH